MLSSRLLFRILYRSAYLLLYAVLLALLLITPADAIERSLRNKQNYNVLILAVSYIVTVIVVLFIYAVRLFLNKTALDSIPKAWIPIDKPDLPSHVHKLITNGIGRSAAIAWKARPRLKDDDEAQGTVSARESLYEAGKEESGELGALQAQVKPAVWGVIDHPGWASPNATDLPNLQYATVVSELPNLVEAKALTMAPVASNSSLESPLLNLDAVALLQRPPSSGLRAYLEHLSEVGVLDLDKTTVSLVDVYEAARFSSRAISKPMFQRLMDRFAEVLKKMRPLDLMLMNGFKEEISMGNRAAGLSDSLLGLSRPSSSASGGESVRPRTSSTHGSVRRSIRTSLSPTQRRLVTTSNTSRHKYEETATTEPGIDQQGYSRLSPSSSNPSVASLKSQPSTLSEDSGSVIRLASSENAI